MYYQVQTHVQTARESPDLNMDFHSFDNGCKQLYEYTPMQEYNICIVRCTPCAQMVSTILLTVL